jgi:hypothetical protein
MGAMLAFLGTFWIFCLAFVVIIVAAHWKIYSKAGQPGWAAIIPIYNLYVLTKIIGRPWWFLLLMLVPLVNVVIAFLMAIDLSRAFGQSAWFAVGLIVLSFIFYPILGFGSATYQGPRPVA